MTLITFANPNNPVVPDKAIIHDNESFRVQWSAVNAGDKSAPVFLDKLVITSIPEGCPGSDDVEHEIVFESDIEEAELAAGEAGELQEPQVGPFPAGSYRLTVRLADDIGGGDSAFNCIDIVAAPE